MDAQTASEILKTLNVIEARLFWMQLMFYIWFLVWLFRGKK